MSYNPHYTLPATGFVRLPQILFHIPVSRTTWLTGVRTGKYPAAVKLGPNLTAWRAEDIHELISSFSGNEFGPKKNIRKERTENVQRPA